VSETINLAGASIGYDNTYGCNGRGLYIPSEELVGADHPLAAARLLVRASNSTCCSEVTN